MDELDAMLGLTTLPLSYPAHAEGLDGECFYYSVYFTDGTADEAKADAVCKAVEAYDFNTADDGYAGYLDISATDGKVFIYLDLGNVEPQDTNNVIHGILLALNNVDGIKNVVVNEGCSDFDF